MSVNTSLPAAPYYDPEMGAAAGTPATSRTRGSPTPSLYGSANPEIMGLSYVDIALGMAKESTREQLTSAETWRAFASELAGTFVLVILSCCAMESPDAAGWQSTFASVASVALAYSAGTFALGSGLFPHGFALFNPTLSLSALLTGRLGLSRALLRIAAQLCGAVAGGALSPLLLGRSTSTFCTSPASGVSAGATLSLELLAAAALSVSFVCLAVSDRRGGHAAAQRWPATHAAVSLAVAIAMGRAVGTVGNPAWSLAMAVVSGCADSQWAVWTASALAAVIAAIAGRLHAAVKDDGARSAVAHSRSQSFSSIAAL